MECSISVLLKYSLGFCSVCLNRISVLLSLFPAEIRKVYLVSQALYRWFMLNCNKAMHLIIIKFLG